MSNLLQQPDALSLLGNMKTFIVSADADVSFTLTDKKTGDTVFQHVYQPDAAGRIEINVTSAIEPLLTFTFRADRNYWEQSSLMRTFLATIDSAEYSFKVIRGGVRNLADTAENFLRGNFLTWQAQTKGVTAYSPEYLTYYASSRCYVNVLVHFANQPDVPHLYTLYTLYPGIIWTFRVDYTKIYGLVNKAIAYYDVIIQEPNGGPILTYTQRYYAQGIRSEQERWYLFENSLGGIDCLRAYGDTSLNAEHTHNQAEIEDTATEYRVDTERKYTQHTGHLDKTERLWLLDFFPAKKKYIYIDNHLEEIVLTESSVEYRQKELPSQYAFTFRFADVRPYLNLPRTTTPLTELTFANIDKPDFTLAPRLYDYARLELSRGALFPVQSPFADEWNTTTLGAIADFLEQQILSHYDGEGGVGHVHANLNLLNDIAMYGQYLLVGAQKIKAALADKATAADGLSPESADWAKILRRDAAQSMPFPLTLEDEVIVGQLLRSPDFVSGMIGQGFRLRRDGSKAELELDRLSVRDRMQVNQLEILRETYSQGNLLLGAAACHVVHVRPIDENMKTMGIELALNNNEIVALDIDTHSIHTYPRGASPVQNSQLYHYEGFRLYFLANDGETAIVNLWRAGDMARCKDYSSNRAYWRQCIATGTEQLEDGKLYHYIDLSNYMEEGEPEQVSAGLYLPCWSFDPTMCSIPLPGDHVCQCGNVDTPDRQNLIIVDVASSSAPSISQYKGIGSDISTAETQYNLVDHLQTTISPNGNIFRGKSFKIETEDEHGAVSVMELGPSISLQIKDALNSAGIDIDSGVIHLYGANTVIDSDLTVGRVESVDRATGLRTIIEGGTTSVYGLAGVANLRYGVDEYGMARIEFYDDTGNLLWFLDSTGVAQQVTDDTYASTSCYKFSNETDLTASLPTATELVALGPTNNTSIWKYQARKIGSVYTAGRFCQNAGTAEQANGKFFDVKATTANKKHYNNATNTWTNATISNGIYIVVTNVPAYYPESPSAGDRPVPAHKQYVVNQIIEGEIQRTVFVSELDA